MPELPEVETTLRGLTPYLLGQSIVEVTIRNAHLRWPIPAELPELLRGKTVQTMTRRAKYLLFKFEHGTLLIHLGMSGSLRLLTEYQPADKHDHFELLLQNGNRMRLRDPRRFGSVLWQVEGATHPLLSRLGAEPLQATFTAEQLYQAAQRCRRAIKILLMENKVVVGVGNIYANEALFRSGIAPFCPANQLGVAQCEKLVREIKNTLTEAIAQGGSSLRDYVNSDGKQGYFQQNYSVYGREGQPCRRCATPIKMLRQGQRASFYCPHCQQ